jgi:hypothetical protein
LSDSWTAVADVIDFDGDAHFGMGDVHQPGRRPVFNQPTGTEGIA